MICLGICRGKLIVCSLWLFQTSYHYFTHLFLLVYLPPSPFPKEPPFSHLCYQTICPIILLLLYVLLSYYSHLPSSYLLLYLLSTSQRVPLFHSLIRSLLPSNHLTFSPHLPIQATVSFYFSGFCSFCRLCTHICS